jgi:hypothetical protein
MVKSGSKYLYLVGTKVNNLEVLGLSDGRSINYTFQMKTRCVCGVEKLVSAPRLANGTAKSCGCLGGMQNRRQQRTHGFWQKGTYNSWANAKRRCNNPKNPRYRHYGGRGIQVCDRWKTFEQFLIDMGERPSNKHSLDRIDVDGNYCPENCRWATNREQGNNTKRNVRLVFEGRVRTISEWSTELGISYSLLHSRIQNGWTVRRTLTEPSNRKRAA